MSIGIQKNNVDAIVANLYDNTTHIKISVTSTNKDNWKHFNFKTPIVKNKDFSLMTCSYIDGSTNKYEDFQTTENTYRNLSFTIPDKANYSNILQ